MEKKKCWLGEYNPEWDKAPQLGRCNPYIFKNGVPVISFLTIDFESVKEIEETIGEICESIDIDVETIDWYSAGDFGEVLTIGNEVTKKAFQKAAQSSTMNVLCEHNEGEILPIRSLSVKKVETRKYCR